MLSLKMVMGRGLEGILALPRLSAILFSPSSPFSLSQLASFSLGVSKVPKACRVLAINWVTFQFWIYPAIGCKFDYFSKQLFLLIQYIKF
jgi:hypothetical protein